MCRGGDTPIYSQPTDNPAALDASGADLIRDDLLHELFERQADIRPDAPAIECAGQTLSYGELDHRANRMAHQLRESGAGRGCFVAILLPRSADIYVAMLGILKCGAAYVPLDADYPADRIGFILNDCRVHTLITTAALAALHAEADCQVLCVDSSAVLPGAPPPSRLCRADTGTMQDDLCYVIYTSGTTGRPKGVEITHRSASHLVRAEGAIFNVATSDRCFHGSSIAFDASVEEIWLPLFAGATLIVGTAEMIHAGPALAHVLNDARVTVLSCVPTLLALLASDIPSIRLLILGGETCPQDLVRRWAAPGRRMVNTYGPTEATVIATYGDLSPTSPVTIGRPLPNYAVYLLDEELRPVPAGQVGEIYIAGTGLARGYLNRPDLSAARFISSPFSSERLYKTGDLARLTASGELEFCGRGDTQVKLRGFRIELAEIESALMQSADIQCAVVCLREEGGVQKLAAFVIARAGCSVEEPSLKSHLRSLLPGYMIPSTIDALPVFPSLPSGKVDRKSLPAPASRDRELDPSYDPPRTPVERKLAAAWEMVFAPAVVSRTDDFFLDLGGHSLIAATTVSRLREQPAFAGLSVLDVYHFPTVAALAAELEQRHREEPEAAPARAVHKPSPLAHFVCAVAQLPCL